MQRLFVCLRNTGDFIQFSVSEIQENICCDHSQIQKIKKQHIPFFAEGRHIGFVHEFGRDAGNITKEDQAQKCQAFALCGSYFIGFDHVHGPGGTKAEDHGDF